MYVCLTLFLGAIVVWIIISLTIGLDKLTTYLNVPKYIRASDRATTFIMMGLVLPMIYGVGDLSLKLVKWIRLWV